MYVGAVNFPSKNAASISTSSQVHGSFVLSWYNAIPNPVLSEDAVATGEC